MEAGRLGAGRTVPGTMLEELEVEARGVAAGAGVPRIFQEVEIVLTGNPRWALMELEPLGQVYYPLASDSPACVCLSVCLSLPPTSPPTSDWCSLLPFFPLALCYSGPSDQLSRLCLPDPAMYVCVPSVCWVGAHLMVLRADS